MSMQPGIELDKLVCEKVLGLSAEQADKEVRGGFMPSLKISHSWEVVEHMRKAKTAHIIVWPDDSCDRYSAADFTEQSHAERWIDGDLEHYATAETAPHAICLASLRAVGIAC